VTTGITRVVGGTSWLVAPQNMTEVFRFAELIAQSSFVPKEMRGKPGDVLAAIQYGAELDIPPLQAIQGIAIINGRPSMWGDLLLAKMLAHPEIDDIIETFDAQSMTATCTVLRSRPNKSQRSVSRSFSWDDAKTAKLSSRDTYQAYGRRMLAMRARGFAFRDAAADILRGVWIREEAADIPAVIGTSNDSVIESKMQAIVRGHWQEDVHVVDPTSTNYPKMEDITQAMLTPKVGIKGPIIADEDVHAVPAYEPVTSPFTDDDVHGKEAARLEAKRLAATYWFTGNKHTGKKLVDLDTNSLSNYVMRLEKAAADPKWADKAEPHFHAATVELEHRRALEARAIGADTATGECYPPDNLATKLQESIDMLTPKVDVSDTNDAWGMTSEP
jgi:hypothetical protein